MKAQLYKQIINSIKPNQTYKVMISPGVEKDMNGISFRGHLAPIYKNITDENGEALLKSITEKQVVKQEDKSSQNGSVPKEKIPKEVKE